jgi:hypothetical protein
MIISESKKYIFIHVPKTAGMSIRGILTDKQNMPEVEGIYNYYLYRFMAHVNAIKAKKRLGDIFDNYFKFAFIRNPFDRLVSMYFSNKQLGNEWIKEFDTFEKFINGLIGGEVKKYRHYESLSYYLVDKDNNITVDFIGKYENLENDFGKISNILGLTGNIPKINTSEHDNYRKYYNHTTKELVYKYYQKDFELFGYEF